MTGRYAGRLLPPHCHAAGAGAAADRGKGARDRRAAADRRGGRGLRANLDRLLWTYSAESFLPHAQIGAGDDEAQPILLAADVNAANRARTIALADGEWRDAALDFDRAFFFFDEAGLKPARAAWSALKTRENVERRYWRQNEQGRWENAA
jgi:DNA polymerase-3 subunit chi